MVRVNRDAWQPPSHYNHGPDRARNSVVDGIEVVDIAHAIELALAPVFLLSGIWVFLGVLASRLARIVDRARNMEKELRVPEARDADRIRSQLQALSRCHPELAAAPGRARRVEFEYERHGTLAYFGAYDVHRAQLMGRQIDGGE